ncbi:MAG TPA: 2-C-methyl-D-erythritol 2,4-cyclodiphosphate synthase [Candidatus Eisenbacteria bacterium]|nr:2-C-methyl-D-erythritol 2,4-cyclodiphosphate synthase [Candidatus Eisenbacteria bacterium]
MIPDTSFRIGHGYDAHRFADGRPLVLGGVRIEHRQGLSGHSDADVLTHAVIDAMLGAMALGDIGTHFPPDDGRWKDASSLDLLARARDLVKKAGGRVIQVDTIVYLEAPRIASFVPRMREELARVLGLSLDRLSVKATTTEGMGFVGREEGAAATAVAIVLLDSPAKET